jgi:hypothetical protein
MTSRATGSPLTFGCQCENLLYRVHRYFFERESPYWRQRFSAPAAAGQPVKGSSDSNPFPLEVRRSVSLLRCVLNRFGAEHELRRL